MTERLFTVDGNAAVPATPVSLAEAGLKERSDLQEWVLHHPDILGPGILVVAFEFDQWQSSAGRERDRLDVLGIDAEGRLVVAELKRDRAPDTVEMQAIKYAAMASRFTEETLIDQYLGFLRRDNPDITRDVAKQQLIEHAGDLDPEQLRQPRIVLVAGSYPPVVTATAVWLTDMGLDITLQQVQAYRVLDDRVVITVSRLFPVADVEEFMVSPQRQQVQQAKARRRSTRELSTVVRLVQARILDDGTELFLRPTTELGAADRATVEAWIVAHPEQGRARWFNDSRRPLEWAHDGQHYRPTQIVQQILIQALGSEATVRGPSWWVTADGGDLPTLAGVPRRGTFDWTELHDLLAAIPKGRWTTYGDLAELVGTAPQPLGQHVTRCTECPKAWRILGGDGRPREGFRWSSSERTDTQQDALSAEGIQFLNGIAALDQRINGDELGSLITT